MTRPTLIALVDAGEGPKIAVQSFLYGTLPRGVVIQSMHVVLHRGQLRQIFSVWGASDGGPAEFGNGRRVGPEGAALMHHFLLPPDGTTFNFLPGKYRLEVFASVAHKAEDINLFEHDFELSDEHVAALSPGLPGVTFTWGPATKEFAPHVRTLHTPLLEAGPMPIGAALAVELIASGAAAVIFDSEHTTVHFEVRILNKSGMVVLPEALTLDWGAHGGSFSREGSEPVKTAFRPIGPAEHFIVPVDVKLRFYDGEAPGHVQLRATAKVVAVTDEWGGSRQEPFASFTWGVAIDQRRPAHRPRPQSERT